MEWEWISVKDELPIIPEGKFAVSVIVAVYDPVYAEGKADPRSGYDVYEAMYKSEEMFIEFSVNHEDWWQICDEVTHWMYMPLPPMYEGGNNGKEK